MTTLTLVMILILGIYKKVSQRKIFMHLEKKENEILSLWSRSIVNHMWWSAQICGGDEDLLVEKWLGILYHIVNVHEWPTGKCDHEELAGEHLQKAWLVAESPAHESLRKIVTDAKLLKDLRKLRHFVHTSKLESYHQEILKYAPKRIFFPKLSMQMRIKLSVIDHNMSVQRQQGKEPEKKWPMWRKSTKRRLERCVYVPKDYEWRFVLFLT